MVSCTRWKELQDTVIRMGELSEILGARTDFHLLNPSTGGQFLSLCPPTSAMGSGARLGLPRSNLHRPKKAEAPPQTAEPRSRFWQLSRPSARVATSGRCADLSRSHPAAQRLSPRYAP